MPDSRLFAAHLGFIRSALWEGDIVVRAEPFDAIELDLATLWNL